MAFQRGTFLGSTVRSLTSSIGWGVGQPSQLTVSLVDDPRNGDSFSPPMVGTPCYFSFYNMNFFGLLQKWEERNAIDGSPVYDVTLVDPREILDGAQVIIGGYRGTTGGVPNLINAYGWWENQKFGKSMSNEAGMPWNLVYQAITSIVNTSSVGDYGGPLALGSTSYGLDLSQLPMPGNDYRVGGHSVNLMEVIAQICEDGGCDFFVELVGYTIRIRTVSRRNQPSLGTIQNLVHQNTGTVARSTNGLELRNEVTSSFLVGGEVTTLFQTDGIRSFWGYDVNGAPVWGKSGELKLTDDDGTEIVTINTEFMDLNSASISDITGRMRYKCSKFEMQCALSNYNTWAQYMYSNKRNLLEAWGVLSAFTTVPPNEFFTLSDTADVDATQAGRIAGTDLPNENKNVSNSMRLYEFVKGYAEEYMGKKYAIPLPFVLQYQETETLRIVNSYEVSDSGYLDEDASPLGLATLNEDQFRNPDGRYRCFVRFDDLTDADFTNLNPQSSVIQGDKLYTECQVDPVLLFDSQKPYAIITLPGTLNDSLVGVAGNIEQIAGILGSTNFDAVGKAMKQEFFPFAISPDTRNPKLVAIPLKSNTMCYGPWFAAGANGKVNFEVDPGLTPWNYGGWAEMEAAGNSRVMNAITNMQVSETGTLELAEAPIASLGDVLQAGGPNVTNIDIQISPTGGITTSYRFQTYTARFGVFNKHTGERLKRLGLTSQQLRRSLRAEVRNKKIANAVIAGAAAALKQIKKNSPDYLNMKTPHGVFIGHGFDTKDENGNPIVRQSLQASTLADAIRLSNADDDTEYQNTAIMSFNGLLRPFSTNTNGGPGTMSSLEAPPSGVGGLNSSLLNGFGPGHDIETYAWGRTFSGINGFRRNGDATNSRMFGLRGPLFVSGWGIGWDSKTAYPNEDGHSLMDNYMRRQDKWKTGPVDLMWDDNRKVWTCHDIIRGRTGSGGIPAGGSGIVNVPVGTGVWQLYVMNYFSTSVSGNTKTISGFSAIDNAWYVMSADCGSG